MAEQGYPPLFQRKRLKNTIARLVELTILFLCLALLGYRLLHLGNHGFVWLLAFICESWFTFTWILVLNIKWTPTKIETYPERLKQQERELPRLDMFVTTADPVLEPPIITVNTVVSLLLVDYPVNKLACYVSDDAASPLTYYCLVEASKFAKLWVPFCKKYDIPVRAPFRYFDDRKSAFGNNSPEFQREFERMKDEYVNLCHKIEDASNKPEPCNLSGDFEEFSNIDRKSHPTIIKVIWENKEDDGDGVPHLVYVSRAKHPNHPHHYKAGAMNVLTRVSGVLTNAPFMMNVDCDMFVNNPQVVFHSMCLLLGDDERCGFVQFPQKFYDGLKDDPFGNQMVAMLTYIGRGLAGLQGPYYGGTGCFHRRKVIYGLSPNGKSGKLSFDDSEKTFGKALGFNKLVYQTLSPLSKSSVDRVGSLSDSMDEAFQVANCNFESNTMWGKKIGWIYGSTTEDVLTGMNIHSRGWRSMWLATEPHGFLGCAPSCGPDTLVQQKRWSTGLLEIVFGPTGPISATLNGHMEFRQLLSYLWILSWGMRSIFEICYATLPAYCLITNTNFLPKVDEAAIVIPISIFLIFNLYSMWEYFQADQSMRSWWNNQRMSRVITMTAWLFGFITVIIKLLGISDTVFEVTRKEQTSNSSEDDDGTDQKLAGRFTFDGSPVFVPGITILVINLAALGCGFGRLINQGRASGELVCSAYVVLCFWSFLKGIFGKGKYGIPFLSIYKSIGLGLVFLQLCRWGSRV